jgi:hypothetical protein
MPVSCLEVKRSKNKVFIMYGCTFVSLYNCPSDHQWYLCISWGLCLSCLDTVYNKTSTDWLILESQNHMMLMTNFGRHWKNINRYIQRYKCTAIHYKYFVLRPFYFQTRHKYIDIIGGLMDNFPLGNNYILWISKEIKKNKRGKPLVTIECWQSSFNR